MHYRLLALDVDGTPRPLWRTEANRSRYRDGRATARSAGGFVYGAARTARPLAQALQLDAPLVVHNGALVKDLASGQTLQQSYIPN